MAKPPNPLSQADLDRINEALRALSTAQADMDKAESCGVDCQAVREEARARHARLMKYKEVYFPNQ